MPGNAQVPTQPPLRSRALQKLVTRIAILFVLALAIAALAYLWWRSDETDTSLHYTWGDPAIKTHSVDVTVTNGYMCLGALNWTPIPGSAPDQRASGLQWREWTGKSRLWGWGLAYFSLMKVPGATAKRFFGAAWIDVPPFKVGPDNSMETARALILPLWMPGAALASLALWPAAGIIRHVARRRRGACLDCGYPKTAGVTACPECGIAAA